MTNCARASYKANKYANILMPIRRQSRQYFVRIVSFIGGVLAVNGISGLTLGGLASSWL